MSGLVRVRREPRGGARGIAGRALRRDSARGAQLSGRFAEFCLRAGVLKAFERFRPPGAAQHSHVLLLQHAGTPPAVALATAADQDTLFRSPYILRQLGFNARQIDAGFYTTAAGRNRSRQRRLLMHSCARVQDFLANQQAVLGTCGLTVRDSSSRGCGRWTACTSGCRAGRTPAAFKACVLGVAGQRGLALCGCWWRQAKPRSRWGGSVAAAGAVIGVGSIRPCWWIAAIWTGRG